jgi:hypothetical protein
VNGRGFSRLTLLAISITLILPGCLRNTAICAGGSVRVDKAGHAFLWDGDTITIFDRTLRHIVGSYKPYTGSETDLNNFTDFVVANDGTIGYADTVNTLHLFAHRKSGWMLHRYKTDCLRDLATSGQSIVALDCHGAITEFGVSKGMLVSRKTRAISRDERRLFKNVVSVDAFESSETRAYFSLSTADGRHLDGLKIVEYRTGTVHSLLSNARGWHPIGLALGSHGNLVALTQKDGESRLYQVKQSRPVLLVDVGSRFPGEVATNLAMGKASEIYIATAPRDPSQPLNVSGHIYLLEARPHGGEVAVAKAEVPARCCAIGP